MVLVNLIKLSVSEREHLSSDIDLKVALPLTLFAPLCLCSNN